MSRATSLAPRQDGERLSKCVMQLRGCSRREAEQYIEGGWVRVNGEVVEDPPFRVTGQTVSVDSQATLTSIAAVTLLLHKPPQWLDGWADEPVRDARAAAGQPGNCRSLLQPANHSASDHNGLQPLKRHFQQLQPGAPLETGASGLVVFSQDWRTQRKLREDMAVLEHELMAVVRGEAPDEALQKIGRALKNERYPLPETKFSVSARRPDQTTLRLAVKGAHPGLAAHLCELAGLELSALRRIRIGRVALGELAPGQWRYLGDHERF